MEKLLFLVIAALCIISVTSEELLCQNKMGSCCAEGNSWCTEAAYTVTSADGSESCQCVDTCECGDDGECGEDDDCCSDKKSWCANKKRFFLEHEMEIMENYHDEMVADYQKKKREQETNENDIKRKELIGLLQALLGNEEKVE